MWRWLLLHFIRKLIQRLFYHILCLYPLSPCSPPLLEDERRCGAARRFDKVQFSLLHIIYLGPLQFRAVQFPQPVGYACLSLILIFCVSISAFKLVCHTSVISTSSVLSLFSCCRRGCCLGGGGAARTCSNERKHIGLNLSLRRKNYCQGKNRNGLLFLIWEIALCWFPAVGHKHLISKTWVSKRQEMFIFYF